MILIGSKAIKHHFPDFKRDAKDTDYIVKHKPDQKFKRVEFLLNPVLDGFSGSILSPNLLYTLKASHLFWDIQWSKHVYDVQFLKSKGCKIDKDIFYQLYQYWCIIHGVNKRSNLDMTAKDFFNNALKKYDHDFLHTLIKPEPTYKKVLKDGAEVDVDESKYNELSHAEKIDLVREEVYVMAYERLAGRDYRSAYSWMLKQFIMHHAPMYEALFIIDNFTELNRPIINYKKHLDNELQRINRVA